MTDANETSESTRVTWYVLGLLIGVLVGAAFAELGQTAWWLLFPFFVTFELANHVPSTGRRAAVLGGVLLATLVMVIAPLRNAVIASPPYKMVTAQVMSGIRSTPRPSPETLMAAAHEQSARAEALARSGQLSAAVDTLANAVVNASNAGDLAAVEAFLQRQIELSPR